MTAAFHLEPLGPGHDRNAFSCGVEALDRYLSSQAGQDIKRRVSACYVALELTSGKVAGYYTLAAGSVPLSDLAPALTKRLPRYRSVPVARVGRMAIDMAFQGQKLGGALLADAAVRAARSEAAVFALIVDAKDGGAAVFYRHHGFEPFGGNPLQLIVPLQRFLQATG